MIKKKNKPVGGGRRFFSGVIVLSLATLVVKAIGVFFKIPMLDLIGIEGMGYFNAAYHFFSLLMTISTAGLPVALSILVSKDRVDRNLRAVGKDYRCALLMFGACGALFTVLMFVFSDSIAAVMGIEKTALCLRAVAPAVFLVTVSGSVRGYFQGFEVMYPTALSEIIEALGKLFLGLGFALYAINKGKEPFEVAAYAITGLTLGVFVSMLYLVINKLVFDARLKKRFQPSEHEIRNERSVSYELAKIALPVTLSSAVLSLTTLFDTLIIPSSLMRAGMNNDASLNLYSTYTNLAIPMFNFPTAFMMPLSMALVPAVVAAAKKKDSVTEQRVMNSSFRLCGIMALPCTFGLSVLSGEILTMVFGSEQSAVSVATPLLSILSASIFFSGLMTVSNSMLQAYGHQMRPIVSLAAGALVKVVSEAILVSIPAVNIYGAPISTFLCSTTVMVLNFKFLSDVTKSKIAPLKIFVPTLLCAALSAVVAIVSYRIYHSIMHQAVATLLAILTTALFYIVIVIRSGALPTDEILLFPFGEKIYSLLRKIRLVK